MSKYRAKKKNLPFNLTYEYIKSLVVEKCPILGLDLVYKASGKHDNTASLDKIVPCKGYVQGNVMILSWKANRIKTNATPEELMKVGLFCQQLIQSPDVGVIPI